MATIRTQFQDCQNWIRLVAWLAVSWFAMLWTHELGHVLAGWMSGGRLVEVDLLPWHLPQSRFEPDPFPWVTLWGGPLFGMAVPIVVHGWLKASFTRFVYCFCWLANGCYVGLSCLTGDPLLDGPRILNAGTPVSIVMMYCAVAIGFSYLPFRRECIRLLQRPNALSDEQKRKATPKGDD